MRTIAGALLAVLLAAGCDRKPPRATADSTQAIAPDSVSAAPDSAADVTSTWDRDAGAALLVPADDGSAFVVVPGERSPGSANDRSTGAATDVLPGQVTLFSRAGSTGRAKVDPTDASAQSCAWPAARLGPATGADVLPSWTVGFIGGTPAPIPLDSIETASAGDSATLAATVTRLAGGLHDDTVRALRGVPLTVRSAYRFPIGDGRDGLVAVLTRALAQEATPLSERLLIVAERPHVAPGATAAPWLVAYHERVAGKEDDVPATEILTAVALGPARRVTLVLARELASGSQYTLLERLGDLSWRPRWTSVARGC